MQGRGPFLRLTSANLPRSARQDPFGPADVAGGTLLKCLHCGRWVIARDMVWSARTQTWDCPHPECDGSGIGWDLIEVNPRRRADQD